MGTHNVLQKINAYYIGIVILTILPIVLGILLARDLLSQKTPPPVTNQAAQLIEPRTNTWKVTRDVLNAPPKNAPADQMKAYVALILTKAKETDTVTVENCKPDPLVAKVPKSKTITIVNMDTIDHTIIFSPTETFAIPKNGSTKISVPFPSGIQIVGYGCDNSPNGVGRFVSQ